MKTLLIALFGLLVANLTLASTQAQSAASYDGLAMGIVLVIGVVGLIIARRKTA